MTDGTAFQLVERPTTQDGIIEQFQHALIQGELKPGQRLPSEAELCRQWGVGRSTVREVIKALTAIGAVEVRRGGGTYISERITPRAIMPLLFAILVETETTSDLQEFRFIFDSGYYKAAARKGTPEDFRAIEEQILRMEAYIASGEHDPAVLAQLDLDFHVAVMQATHNPLIFKVGQLLNTMLHELIKRNMAAPGAGEWTVHRHRVILEILKSRDPQKVEPAMADASAGLRKIVHEFYTPTNQPESS